MRRRVPATMKHAALVLFTALTLLTQGLAWAAAAPMLPPAAQEQNMPCHEEAADAAMPCCADECGCADLCVSHASIVTPVFSFAAPSRADFRPQAFTGLRLGIHHHERLRPPIALQS